MAKFSGMIGFTVTTETSPGVWTDNVVEKPYRGDLIRHSRHWDSGDGLHNDIRFSQEISIIADPYLNANINNMVYVVFQGVRWSISSFEISYPRVTISMGGEWHGNTPTASD